MSEPGRYAFVRLSAMPDEALHSLAASISMRPEKWNRRRLLAELVVQFSQKDSCKHEFVALPCAELKVLAGRSGITTKCKTCDHIVAGITAYRIMRNACLREVESLPTEDLVALSKKVGIRPQSWSRRQLLKKLMIHHASADPGVVALEPKATAQLRAMLIEQGIPALDWSRSRCLEALASLLRVETQVDSVDPGSGTGSISEQRHARLYATALQQCVVANSVEALGD